MEKMTMGTDAGVSMLYSINNWTKVGSVNNAGVIGRWPIRMIPVAETVTWFRLYRNVLHQRDCRKECKPNDPDDYKGIPVEGFSQW